MHAPRPLGRHAMQMRWLSLLFMHWPVPAEAVRRMSPRIPGALEIDEFEGSAWVGLIPFTMRDVRAARFPGIPGATHFHECNVRTYVRHGDDIGVWFFSLDAASRLAVWAARKFYHLNYVHSRMTLQREGTRVLYGVARRDAAAASWRSMDERARRPAGASLRCAWRPGRMRARSRHGELAHFLTERYSLYSSDALGNVYRGRIWHEPWTLRDAELLECEDGLVRAAGLELDGPPSSLLHADMMTVRAWPLERIPLERIDGPDA